MTLGDDVLSLFEQLYRAEQELAANTERERLASLAAHQAQEDRKEAERQVAALRERMQALARKAAGVPEREPDGQERAFSLPGYHEFRPLRRGI